MPYLWLDTATIQAWLTSVQSSIQIGDESTDNYSTPSAIVMENAAVMDIEMFLDPGWVTPLPTGNPWLCRLVAQLSAAYIGQDFMGVGIGQGTAAWTHRYENHVFAMLSRLIATHDMTAIDGAMKREMTAEQRLRALKTRQQGVVSDD